MRILLTAIVSVVAAAVISGAQAADARVEPLLKRLFPDATRISAKEGAPPHFSVFGKRSGADGEVLVGFGFWTTELEPLERGYDGPIKILVGMDTRGILAGVKVTEHHEPYGSFSVEPPRFAAQFK